MKFFACFIGLFFLCRISVYSQNFEAEYAIWKQIVESVYNELNDDSFESTRDYRNSVYSTLAKKYYEQFLESGSETFYLLAFNEFGTAKRQGILQESENFSSFYRAHVNRRASRVYDPELFEIREFTLVDIYLFQFADVPALQSESALKLLNYWINGLSAVKRENPQKAALMALVMADGFYNINKSLPLDELFKYVDIIGDLPPSHLIHSIVQILSFSAERNNFYTYSLEILRDLLLPITRQINDTEHYLHTKIEYGTLLFRLGLYSEALTEFEYVIQSSYRLTSEQYISALNNNIAVSYLNTGRFNNYIDFQLRAYEQAVKSGNKEFQLSFLRNLFIFHRRQNEFDLALNYLDTALTLARENRLFNELPSILISLAYYKKEVQQNTESAVEILLESIEISRNLNSPRVFQNSTMALAQVYTEIGYFDEAIALYEHLINEENLVPPDRAYIELITRKAFVNLESGNTERASYLIKDTESNDLERLFFNDKIFAKNVINRLLILDGKEIEALESYTTLIPEILNWLRESANPQTGHMRMDSEFSEAFRLATKLFIDHDRIHEAIQLQEDIRNISRSGFFNAPLLKARQLSDDELIQDYILSNRIQRFRSELQDASIEERVRIQNLLLEATNQKNQLLSTSFRSSTSPESADIERIQEHLKSDETVLYINIIDDELFIFVIRSNNIDVRIEPFDKQQSDKIIQAVDLLVQGKTNLELLYSIYEDYFSDFQEFSTRHLYVIPDGVFYRVPFEVLPVSKPTSPISFGTTNYLIEHTTVSYINAMSDLLSDKIKGSFEYDFTGFGISDFSHVKDKKLNQLPFAKTEINQATQTLTHARQVASFQGDLGTEKSFREMVGNSSILHLATHSEIAEENPLFSVIYLQPDEEPSDHTGDGLVHAYELFEMNLSSRLVVLSSCNSGSGAFLKGSGVLGFSRAIQYAGAESLIMNVWPVRDQTAAEISQGFYSYLNEGYGRADALRQSRLDYLNYTNSDPYLWGSLVLYGDISPIIKSRNFLPYIILISAAFLIGLLLWIKRHFFSTRNQIQ